MSMKMKMNMEMKVKDNNENAKWRNDIIDGTETNLYW